jgi:hypothetical protein
VRQRDVDLTPAQEEHQRVTAAAALERILDTPPPRRSRVVNRVRYRWLVFRTLDLRHHRWLFAGVPAVATVLLVVSIMAGSLWPGSPSPAVAVTPPMPVFTGTATDGVPLRGDDAEAVLRHLAERAAAQVDEPAGEVQVVDMAEWWIETDDQGKAKADGGLVPARSQIYTMPDGMMRLIQRRGTPLDPDDGHVEAGTQGQMLSDESFPGTHDFPPLYAQTLPTDPQALSSELIPDPRECPGFAQCIASEIRFLHGMYVVPAKVRAAMWEALAGAQGTWYLGETRDRLGRPAVAIAVDRADNQQMILYTDHDTGAYLGAEAILTENSDRLGLDAPAVLEFMAVVDAHWLDTDRLPPPVDP